MAYQTILSPPGGVWQEPGSLNQTLPPGQFDSYRYPQLDARKEPGAAIMDSYEDLNYAVYLVINTMVLVASLSTIMLALSGFPVQNKFLLWLLIFTMYTTISCIAIAYFLVLKVVFPTLSENYYGSYTIITKLLYIWLGVIGLVVMLHACHFLVWLWSKLVCLWNKFRNLVIRCQTIGRGGRPNHTTHEKSCCLPP